MARKSVSASPVTCKRHLLFLFPLLLLSVFFDLMDCLHALNSVQPLNGLRIDIVRADSFTSANVTFTERWKRAVHRSHERLQKLQLMSGNKFQGDAQTADIQAPVSAGNEEFLINMGIGMPPLSFSAILDTGSDLIWAQCKPCINCYQQPTPVYDPSRSSTYITVPCTASLCVALPAFLCNNDEACKYNYTYADQSFTRGILSFETFAFSSQSLPRIAFGCGNDNGGLGLQGSGVVGFGRGPLSLVSQLGPSLGNRFSYCLVSVTDSPSKTSPLFLGHTASLNAMTISSTPIIQSSANPSFYYLSLEGISVGGQSLSIPAGIFDLQPDGSGGLIIDTGTTYSFLPRTAYNAVKEALRASVNLPRANASSVSLDLCFNKQGSSNPSFPTMTFHFKGADYNLAPENYLLAVDSDVICLAMLPITSDLGGLSIFGNFQQQNYQIFYDNERNVLSFAPTVCDIL